MAKKDICPDSPLLMPKRDRSIIAKVGHIKREIDTNNRLSDKSIERLKKIFTAQSIPVRSTTHIVTNAKKIYANNVLSM